MDGFLSESTIFGKFGGVSNVGKSRKMLRNVSRPVESR